MVNMKKADGGGASFDGEEYEPNKKGIISVPGSAVEELRAHGFEVVEGEPEDPTAILDRLKKDVKNAKEALKKDPDNEDKKTVLELAQKALDAFSFKED
jgi:hypothetical protein